ncbi:uncharacterized protein LOC128982215 isoform X2 [Macrosteles quadrilineatus]|uniref:uncharacterized protein LOC128982215 isoform X2 n=1 Tax=Macrosteles quadrilineatus TaxID=74068 RepID=UPI0023E21E4B|nr:uncharacterized protein LOC128982215 isoform X2 [Macrosteles quadrilineatus]
MWKSQVKMDVDKRYCQNRQRKRKRTFVPSPIYEKENVSPSEEERQFKLRRFVEDVGKFWSEKENVQSQEIVPKTKMKASSKAEKLVKKANIPKHFTNKSLFQRRGMQTKIFKRSGVMTREMTAKLDEDLHQIISLAKNTQCHHQCECKQQKSIFGTSEHGMQLRSKTLSVLKPLQPRLSPSPSPQPDVDRRTQTSTMSSGDKGSKSMSELAKELYPQFVRVVSLSCSQTKSALFKNQSYVSAVKNKLLEIYVKGMKEESQKTTSSVGTSPFPPTVKTQSSNQEKELPFKLAPAKFYFKSNMQFLEETIGTSSTGSGKFPAQSSQRYQLRNQNPKPRERCRQPPLSLLSPPVVNYLKPQRTSTYAPRISRYLHEPFMKTPSPTSTFLDLVEKPTMFHGCGDGLHLDSYNSFLPPIKEEEDSPDFRYFPRKIF